jgi:hypothetical protein
MDGKEGNFGQRKQLNLLSLSFPICTTTPYGPYTTTKTHHHHHHAQICPA